jgi:hypothetical protein
MFDEPKVTPPSRIDARSNCLRDNGVETELIKAVVLLNVEFVCRAECDREPVTSLSPPPSHLRSAWLLRPVQAL